MSFADRVYEKKEDYIHRDWTLEKRRKHLYKTLLEENRNHLEGRVLMVGCNAGSTLQLLKELAITAEGLDINKRAVAEAVKRGCIASVGNIIEPQFPGETFDAILALDVIEHIFSKDMPRMVEQWSRILKPSGKVVAFSPRTDEKNPSGTAMDKCHVQWFVTDSDFYRDWIDRDEFSVVKIYNETRKNPGLKGKHDAWLMVLKCNKS